jgi:hypothetical protein
MIIVSSASNYRMRSARNVLLVVVIMVAVVVVVVAVVVAVVGGCVGVWVQPGEGGGGYARVRVRMEP